MSAPNTLIARIAPLVAAVLCAVFAHWSTSDEGSLDRAGSPLFAEHLDRVILAVESEGWVAARKTPANAGEGALGSAYPVPPGFDLLVAAVHRRALPNVRWLMKPAGERVATREVNAEERASIGELLRRFPRRLHVLIAALAALLAAGLVRGAANAGALVTLSAGLVAGVGVAVLPIGRDHHVLAALLHLASLGVLSRALQLRRIDQPFGSAARGTCAGLFAGFMVITWAPSILWVMLVEVAFVLRLFLRFNGADGARTRARGLPVLTTAFHKAALIVVMPAVIDSAFTDAHAWGLLDLSWFHIAWLSIGWMVFAPYALLPRIAVKKRFVALLPAALVFVALLLGTDAPASAVDAVQRLVGPSTVRWGSVVTAITVLVTPLVLWMTFRASVAAPSLLPFIVTLPVALCVALAQQQLGIVVAGPFAVLLAFTLAKAVAGHGVQAQRATEL